MRPILILYSNISLIADMRGFAGSCLHSYLVHTKTILLVVFTDDIRDWPRLLTGFTLCFSHKYASHKFI